MKVLENHMSYCYSREFFDSAVDWVAQAIR